ncbi:MAG: UDP-N-acetylglucosamine--N-acetylmuramyl-(pentapeptide) pyrophosphoryl-undecaprenol N-acetylglucosamine transferase [Parcubacteria group bacterium]|nr:MAG: UDP-N-acetylglucosamine--N-acetylmuramyl-(pentapeptide) pyrophosphoryl-undecaprenol N-acetylglucosamine transferase [Parcubacteria group bacterium]
MKIIFTGGGSGGHVVPFIAIVREIRRIYPDRNLEFQYFGPKDEFGEIFLSHEEIKIKNISAGKIRRYKDPKSIFENLIDIFFNIPLGIIQSFFSILFSRPDLIFSKGGYGSIPAVIAGKMLFVPIFIHESDVSPGAANRLASKMTKEIFVSFPRTEYFPMGKMTVVGNPIRKEVLQGTKEEAREMFKLNFNRPVLLVLGGSQGAQRINDKILELLPTLLDSFEIILQCGESNYREVRAEAKITIEKYRSLESAFHLYPFLQETEIRQAYGVADFIVGRAGAGTIFEIAANAKPSILVPLPESAQNHQVKNAYAYGETGACMVMEENNFTVRFFLEKLRFLFANPQELEKMRKAAEEFSRPLAAKMLAERILRQVLKKYYRK